LPQGECSFEVEVLPQAVTQVSVWAWAAKKPGPDSDYPNALPKPELLYLDAVPLLPPTDVESIERKEMRPAVLERISGVFLDAIEPVSAEQGWGELKRNMAVTERPMTIGGQRYRRGLGTHAVSRIVYELDGETYATFVSDVGVDGGGSGSVEFVVRVDGEIYYKSGRMTAADAARRVEVGVTGAKELELYVSDAEDGIISDHANWAGARLLE
jgi:hypothetical protein